MLRGWPEAGDLSNKYGDSTPEETRLNWQNSFFKKGN
jgi:hypothetical protein